MFHKPTPLQVVLSGFIFKLPLPVIKLLQTVALRGSNKLRRFHEIANRIGSDIIQRELIAAKGEAPQGKDIMSNLGKLRSDIH